MRPRLSLSTIVISAALAAAGGSRPVTAAAEPVGPLFQNQRPSAAAATGVARRLVGAWTLTTRTVRRADGTVLADPVLGAQPVGRLLYDASGTVMLQMMRQDRAAAISTPSSAADAANPRVVLGYDAYFGTYTVDEAAGTITHRVVGSLFPEDLGKDFVRLFTLDGDTLTLKFTSVTAGSEITRTLVFRRAS